MKTQIRQGMTNEDYHAAPGLSASGLKLLARSPAHFRFATAVDTEALRFGTAAHCAVLEPERFTAEYIRAPEGVDRRTKEGKAAWAEFEERAAGRNILKAEDYANVAGLAASARDHPIARKFFTGGTAEQSVFWTERVYYGGDGEMGVMCKCRPDYVKETEDGAVIVDLKTTRDAGAGKFSRAAYWDYGYHIQAAHYMRCWEAATKQRPAAFVFVAVEKTFPWAVNVFQAAPDFLAAGAARCQELYKVYAACVERDEWPGYPALTHDLNLPKGADWE